MKLELNGCLSDCIRLQVTTVTKQRGAGNTISRCGHGQKPSLSIVPDDHSHVLGEMNDSKLEKCKDDDLVGILNVEPVLQASFQECDIGM